jgi:hypothetical protein
MHSAHAVEYQSGIADLLPLKLKQVLAYTLDLATLHCRPLSDVSAADAASSGRLSKPGSLRHRSQQMIVGVLWYTMAVALTYCILQALGIRGLAACPVEGHLDPPVPFEDQSLAAVDFALDVHSSSLP